MELGDYFNEGTSPSVKTAKQPAIFQIADLYLKASIDAKITHLINRNKVYATHIALGIFYDKIPNLIDDFVETCAGIYNLDKLGFSCSEITDNISYFKNLYAQVEKIRSEISDKFIQSQIDLLQQESAHCLYRLTHMTT